MRVLLIVPPLKASQFYSRFSFAGPVFPAIGLAYIAAVLEKHGHIVKILDCFVQKLDNEKLISYINLFQPEIIGISVTTASYHSACNVLTEIKNKMPNIVVVFGGPHPTVLPEKTMQDNPLLDLIVIGEGEFTMLDVVEHHPLSKITGIIYRSNNCIIRNSNRPLIEQLDKLPHPARHLLPSIKENRDAPTRSKIGNVIHMISSRGCPFRCGYCQQLYGRTWRAHSADYLIDEIQQLQEHADVITFEDDNFVLDQSRVIEFCTKIVSLKLKFSWNIYMRLDSVNEELLFHLKRAGCNCVFVGVESGDKNILKLSNKRISLEIINNNIRLIKYFGIDVHASFILGFPGETKESIDKTIRLALSLPIDGVTFNLFTPFPKTYLGNIASQYGVVSKDWNNFCDHGDRPPFVPDGFKEKELIMIQHNAYKKFYFRFKSIIKYRKRLFDRKFILSAIRAIWLFLTSYRQVEVNI